MFAIKHNEVNERLVAFVDSGYATIRKLDNAVKAIKCYPNIRKRYTTYSKQIIKL